MTEHYYFKKRLQLGQLKWKEVVKLVLRRNEDYVQPQTTNIM